MYMFVAGMGVAKLNSQSRSQTELLQSGYRMTGDGRSRDGRGQA